MAAFNQWVKGSFLEDPRERRVVEVANNLMHGAATLLRARFLSVQGVAAFSRSGQVTIASGSPSKKLTGVPLSASSLVLATILKRLTHPKG